MTSHNQLVVKVDSFECRYCVETRRSVLSREDGQWVHNSCGMEVTEDDSESADEQLRLGNGRYDHTEKRAKALAGALNPDLLGETDG